MKEFGTMEDMEVFIKEAHKRGIKLLIDIVVNHSSKEHSWFLKSCAREGKYADYYIWRKGKGKNGKKKPSNWGSIFGDSTWEWNEQR